MSIDRSTIWPYEDSKPAPITTRATRTPPSSRRSRRSARYDGGDALLYPSGSAATTALVLGLLKPGDTIALAEGCYFGTGVNFKTLERWGLHTVEFDQTGPPPQGVQLVWLEAPSTRS